MGGDGEDVLDGKAKVIEKSGKDVTKQYINGAYAALKKLKSWEQIQLSLRKIVHHVVVQLFTMENSKGYK